MTPPPAYPARATIIFCDDVRREEGNKSSIMGVYASVMGIAAPAQPLAKLVVAFILDLPPGAVGTALKLSVLNGEERMVEVTATPMRPAAEQLPAPAFGHRIHMVVPIEILGFMATEGMSLTGHVAAPDLLDFQSDPLLVVNTTAVPVAETH